MPSPRQGTGLALWLVPEADVHRRLAGRIAELSRRFGTPSFAPHVTLLSGIRVEVEAAMARTEELAASLRPFRVRLTSAGQEPEYFRAVFLEVEPSAELLEAHRRAVEVFGVRPPAPFRPHLSLLYGDLGEEDRRQAVASAAESGSSFLAASVELVRTVGTVEEWDRVAAFSFGAEPE